MNGFLRRFFPKSKTRDSDNHRHDRIHGHDQRLHEGFKTPRGQGPFLLSCDGRVIPLRKARFLRHP